MSFSVMPDIDRFLRQHERNLLLLFGLCAALRLFFFSAAFPFFNNVDEKAHFDTVYKHSRGYLPRGDNDRYSPEAAAFIVLYHSPEYRYRVECFPNQQVPPPLWKRPPEMVPTLIREPLARWQAQMNHEAWSPPVYYLLAGQWFNLGRGLGLQGGDLLYWIRFLNIPLGVLLVWLAYRFGRDFFSDDPLVRVGGPGLVAFLPQDVFYSINSDVPCALLFGLSLHLLLQIYFQPKRWSFCIVTGLVVAATLLTKLTNLVLLVVAALVILAALRRCDRAEVDRGRSVKLLVLLLVALLPLGAWMAWNWHFVGDPLATQKKVGFAGLAIAPLGEWWQNPVFTLGGFAVFVRELIVTFWRGAFAWHDVAVATGWADGWYVGSTLLFIALALFRAGRRRDGPREQFVSVVCLGTLVLFVVLLVGFSIRLKYVDPVTAARHPPFICDGRFVLGGVIPFVVLYLRGMETLLAPFRRFIHPFIFLLVVMMAMTVSEIVLTLPIFHSPHNWFHLS